MNGLEYTDVYHSGHRSSGGLRYSAPHAGIAGPHPAYTPPRLDVRGVVIPYGTVVDNGEGRELFTFDTVWDNDDPNITLALEHGARLGHGRVVETGSGLWFDGTVDADRRDLVGARRQLSARFMALDSHRRADGVTVHDRCRLLEVSLVRRARLAPYTYATID